MEDYKLFIWNEPYSVRYGASVVYAVGRTVEEARAAVRQARVAEYGMTPRDDAKPVDPEGRWTLGDPTRVLPVPCAEIYEWSE